MALNNAGLQNNIVVILFSRQMS